MIAVSSKELRIGNYFFDREKRLCKVEAIGIDSFYAPAIHGGRTSIPNSPIPITEDELVRFGFKKWKTKGITYSRGKMIIHLRKRGWVINKSTAEPKYMHTLQNRYYALYEEEL
jgi:hypothetical protein